VVAGKQEFKSRLITYREVWTLVERLDVENVVAGAGPATRRERSSGAVVAGRQQFKSRPATIKAKK
jgi:hypothetical protein